MQRSMTEQLQQTVPTTEQMHAAIRNRDAAYDGRFFFGVVTTGVYCRPSCPSRPAKPGNVRFFADAETAAAAGFRPCMKCKPDEFGREVEKLVGVARYIESHANERLTLAQLARKAGLSEGRFRKVFKAAFGVSPKSYQDAVRLELLKGSLKDGDDVAGAIFGAGFGSTSRVYGEAARNMGMTPAAYRAGGKGEQIYFAYRKSAMGPLMMAATARGVCFAQFGESRNALLEQLRKEFPGATILGSPAEDAPALDDWIEALDRHLANEAPRPDLPLDLRGTAFQLKVWRFLLSVKEGDVVSYGELAKGIGRPKAVRAAASACGANRVSVLVPCHRVLRGDGELGGYRWGVERKRTLLDIERRTRT
jgi:AraC family transcriptional regulator of adaptative response/methylated-DNA-[protein]-cysteine methyltransferase